jgi:hypothetical protein
MNAFEQPLKQTSGKEPMVDAPRISPPASRTIGKVFTQSERRRSWEFRGLAFVIGLSGILVLVHYLQPRTAGLPLPPQEFGGLAVVACALAYIGIFLWRLSRAFLRDAEQVEASEKRLESPSTLEREMNPAK